MGHFSIPFGFQARRPVWWVKNSTTSWILSICGGIDKHHLRTV
jgi:hypothetical protein